MKECLGLGTNNLELAANFYEQLLNSLATRSFREPSWSSCRLFCRRRRRRAGS